MAALATILGIQGEVSSPNKARDKYDTPRGHDLKERLEVRREKDLRDKLMDNHSTRQRDGPRETDGDWKQKERNNYSGW